MTNRYAAEHGFVEPEVALAADGVKIVTRHMIKSVRYDPWNLAYFAAYPLRVASRVFARA